MILTFIQLEVCVLLCVSSISPSERAGYVIEGEHGLIRHVDGLRSAYSWVNKYIQIRLIPVRLAGARFGYKQR